VRPPAEDRAEAARPVVKAASPLQRRLKEVQESLEEHYPQACGIANLVNYASAPVGGQTYDAAWLASNTAVR
jgi:hypothetical protein